MKCKSRVDALSLMIVDALQRTSKCCEALRPTPVLSPPHYFYFLITFLRIFLHPSGHNSPLPNLSYAQIYTRLWLRRQPRSLNVMSS
jgi:hypothetical protein